MIQDSNWEELKLYLLHNVITWFHYLLDIIGKIFFITLKALLKLC